MIDEDALQLLQGKLVVHRAQALIELYDVTIQRDTPSLQATGFHHVAQLLLVELYGLVDFFDFHIVALDLQIQLTLFGNVTGGNGEVYQLALIVIDGVYTNLQKDIHLTFWNNT